MSMLDIAINLGQIWYALSSQNSNLANERSYTSCTEGAATETEDEDFVAGDIVGCDE